MGGGGREAVMGEVEEGTGGACRERERKNFSVQ